MTLLGSASEGCSGADGPLPDSRTAFAPPAHLDVFVGDLLLVKLIPLAACTVVHSAARILRGASEPTLILRV